MSQHVHCLQGCLEGILSEIASLSVVGRPLTAEETARLNALQAAAASLRQAIAALRLAAEQPQPDPPIEPPQPDTPPESPPVVPLDGLYTGGDGDRRIEMRVDVSGSNMISLDIFQISASGGRTWLATVRTAPGTLLPVSAGEFAVVAEGQDGNAVTGKLQLDTINGDEQTAGVVLELDAPATGIAGNVAHNFVANWQEAALRSLGLEVERETGLDAEPTFQRANGDVVSVTTCLTEAGFARFDMGQASQIPAPPPPGKWGTAQLHALMVQHAQSTLTSAKNGLHLLRLSESTMNGLLGIMFDSGDTLPRQGSAVFEQEIDNFYPLDRQRKTIQTTVHELGHALNLAHRFERVVGRADSLSFMNYDSKYKGGGHQTEFWNNFDFKFDHDELAFLRHGPLSAVIPGGRDFHTVPYWSEGNGGYVPYMPEQELTFLSLELSGPGGVTNAVVFDFMQPVFMGVKLTNNSGQTLDLQPHFLDPKSGSLDIVIRRVIGGADLGTGDLWVPMMQRCQAGVQAMRETNPQLLDNVPDGQSIARNLNLTFGAAGFSFAEPGLYDVQAVVSLFNDSLNRNLIVPSNVMRVRIGTPHSPDDENDALVMFRDDVGAYLALGGSRVLDKAHDALQAILARRSDDSLEPVDSVCANIIRCAGIDAGRNYQLQRKLDRGDRKVAADLLEKLDTATLQQYFDGDTATSTASLAKKHRDAT
ncbi:MAG: acetyltransferase [Gammaproteobacteria bacterium]|nr:acetyltransferase [Gammaproteobacteria bacterium]